MQEYNNPGPIENNIYFATHGGQGNITIEAVGGDVDVKNLADLDYWNNKFYSAYGVPKQYYGWTDDAAGFNGGTSLAILSSEFAKGVCTEMEGAAIAHTAYRNNVPFVILRAISDKADDSANMDYPTFEALAAHRCAQVTMHLARQLQNA